MGNMRFKVGDRVRIKSLDWYNKNKTTHGDIWFDNAVFVGGQSLYCGCELTIRLVTNDSYYVIENDYYWTNEMIECKVEEETKPKYEDEVNGEYYSTPKYLVRPSGYQFVDENGNVINATKIVLEKANTLKTQSDNMETETHKGYCTTEEETTNKSKKVAWFTFWDNDFADKVELDLSNRELIQEGGKWFVVKKKKGYPKTYAGCCDTLYRNSKHDECYEACLQGHPMQTFARLLICRDAYWKIAGDEMGLGKPWEPSDSDYITGRYCIFVHQGNIICSTPAEDCPLTFPTEEMRDAFYENFKELIEAVKELL